MNDRARLPVAVRAKPAPAPTPVPQRRRGRTTAGPALHDTPDTHATHAVPDTAPAAVPAPPLAARERRDVLDDDAARALLTRWLVHDLAPLLGLDPARVRIRTDAAAATRVDAAGAAGLSTPEGIRLHPGRFRPETAHGRYLLAHELVHDAQRALPGPASARGPLARAAAEAEAHRIGTAFADGRAVDRPRVALPADALAADAGADAPPPPLATSVLESRSREIALIERFLSGWWISDGDVDNVMQVLDDLPWPVARAIVLALGRKRYALADNINEPHVLKHRRSVLIVYDTLADSEADAIDLDVVRALPDGGMTTEEKGAAAALMRKLGQSRRDKLLAEDRGPRLRAFIAAPLPIESERKRMEDEATKAARDEAALATKRHRIVALKNDNAVKDLVEQVRALLSPREDVDGTHTPNGADALAAVDLLAGVNGDATRLASVGERMEEEGLTDLLLQLLPPGRFTDTSAHIATIGGIVEARLPWKNASLIEELLSTGLFDWSISADEALFAYNIVKSLPLAEQLRFRRRDAGRWYVRLLDNLPRDREGLRRPGLEVRKADSEKDLAQLEAEGIHVDRESMLYDASQVYARKLNEQATVDALNTLLNRFEELRKGVYHDYEARELYLRLVDLGKSSLAPGHERPADRLLREAVVRELDNHGYIDELFGELPESFLFAEEHRTSTVQIMLARDPGRVQNHARELVSRGFTDWMVKDHEAYLAFLCIKALPAEEREAFIAQQPDLWNRVMGEMSLEQRQASDTNAYVGDKAGVDRTSVLAQLAERSVWTGANVMTLDGLLHMALAMTEGRFAFARSQEFEAHTISGLEGVVEKYKLYNPAAGRKEYVPHDLQGTHWYEEGPFQTIKAIGNGLVAAWNTDLLYVDGKLGARIPLNDVQDMLGGDLGGAQLGKVPKKDAASHPHANTVSLLVGLDGKSAELILPELLIDRANVQFGSTTFQTGAVHLKDLRLHASYDAEDLGQPTQAHVVLGSLVANDMLLAFGDGMIAVARLALQVLNVASGAVDTVTGSETSNRKPGSLPFPLLAIPLLALLMLLALPAYLVLKIWGAADKSPGKLERFPGEIQQRTKALDFSFSSLAADGVVTSGGQRVGHVGVEDVAVRVGLNRATRLRAQRASIGQRLARLQGRPDAQEQVAKLEKERAAVDADLAKATLQEKEYLAIREKIRAGGLSNDEQDKLQRDLDRLKFEEDAGAYIDIGEIVATGVSGTVSAGEPIRLAGIHGEGGGSALTDMLAMPTVTDKEVSRRAGAGERPAAPKDTHLVIDIGDASAGKLTFDGGLRTVASIDAQLKKLVPQMDTPEIRPLFDSLLALRGKAQRYELLVQHGVANLDDAQLNEFRALREALSAEASMIVESLAVTQMKLDVDLVSGRVGVGAAGARIKGLQIPGQGIEIDEIVARGLGVGALPNGGLLGWKDWKKNLRDADGHVDSLEVSGVRSRMHGLLFEKATLTGAYADMAARGDTVKAGLKRLEITGAGVAPRIGVLRQRLAALREQHRLATGADKAALAGRIATLEDKVTGLEQLADARVRAYARLQAARTPDEVEAAKTEVAHADSAIILGLAQYGAAGIGVEDFGIKITGLGDVLTDVFEDRFSLDTALERGAHVEGAGDKGMLVRKVTVSGGKAISDKTGASTAAEADVELGATRLNLDAKRKGDEVTVALNQFEIDTLTLGQLLLTSDEKGEGKQIGSTGQTTLKGMHVNGKVLFKQRADVPGKGSFPADFRLASIVIDDFAIMDVSAGGLTYRSIPEKFEATLVSGTIHNIWSLNTTLTFPEDGGDMTVVGAAGIESISNLQVTAALKSGLALTGGRIDSRAIGFEFYGSGGIRGTASDISATALSVRGPDGWARFSLNHLSGGAFVHDGTVLLENVRLGSIEVPAVHWKAGTRTIDADKPVRLVDIRVKGAVTLPREARKAADGKIEQPARPLAVTVDALTIGAVSAGHLVYRDGDDQVEIGPSGADVTAAMAAFRPLAITDVRIEHLEWVAGKGIDVKKLDVGVGKFEAAAVYRNLKDDLRAGIALKGSKLGTSFIGADFIVGSTGKIEKTAGFFKGKGVDTSFTTGQIVGSYTLTDKGVTLNGLDVDNIAIGRTTYTAPGMSVTLGGAGAEHLSIGKVDVALEETVGDDGKKAKKLKSITVGSIELTGLRANTFDYKGNSYEVNAQGQTVASAMELHANRAWIDRFTVHDITHDLASRLTSVKDFAVDSRTGKPAFGVQGVVAKLSSAVMGKHTSKVFLTDIEGGKLTGDDITFQTVSTGAKTADGKDITRPAVGGRFKLTALALLHSMAVFEDEEGKRTYIGGTKGRNARIVIAGVEPVIDPSGNLIVPIKSITAQNFLIQKGDITVTVPLLQLTDFAVALKGIGREEGIQLLAAKLKSIAVRHLRFDMDVDRTAPAAPQKAGDKGSGFGAGKYWYFEPVGGLNADLKGTYDTWGQPTVYWRVRDGLSGIIPLRDVVEHFVNKPSSPDKDNDKKDPAEEHPWMNDVTVSGNAALGDGRIGFDDASKGYPGDDGTYIAVERRRPGDNRFNVAPSRLGERITVTSPHFTAGGGRIAAFGPLPAGKFGPVTVTGLKVTVSGLADLQFHITVTVKNGVIENIEFGDLTLFDKDAAGNFKAVQPPKVPGTAKEAP